MLGTDIRDADPKGVLLQQRCARPAARKAAERSAMEGRPQASAEQRKNNVLYIICIQVYA
jgi:hypothetical protein